MFPVDNIKLNFVKRLQYLLPPPDRINRLLRCSPLIFHILTFLWHIVLNFQTLAGVFYILFNRQDLVSKNYGFGIQYITIWNQVIEQNYFNACLVQDVLELIPLEKYAKMRNMLRKVLPYVFSSLVFPLSILVTINFWAIYSFHPRVIDEDNVTEAYFPSWVNHGLHTTILLLACVEKFLVYRRYPGKIWGFLGLSSVLVLYSITCLILYLIGGVWPYPFIAILTMWQKAMYFYFNVILGYFIIRLGEYLNVKIWNKSSAIALESDIKKST